MLVRLAITAVLATTATACAPNPGVRVVTEGSSAVDSVRGRNAGRAAGAGGSHAPGGTGLGAGTLGADQRAESGSLR